MIVKRTRAPNFKRAGGPTSSKLQALKRTQFRSRIKIESEEKMEVEQLKRIADILEEILKIVKKDMGVK